MNCLNRINTYVLLKTLSIQVSKGAKIRNRYNQVLQLTQDTKGKVTNSQLDTIFAKYIIYAKRSGLDGVIMSQDKCEESYEAGCIHI